MPQGADGGEATFCSWTRQAASKTQLGDRLPEAQAETTRIVERSRACIRSLLSRSTLQATHTQHLAEKRSIRCEDGRTQAAPADPRHVEIYRSSFSMESYSLL